MKKLKVTIELEMTVPDSWVIETTSENTPVIKMGQHDYLDLAVEPLFTDNPEMTWSSAQDDEELNGILDMVDSESVAYELVVH